MKRQLNYADVLTALGFTNWVIFENEIIWHIEPDKKPTKKQLDDKLKELQNDQLHTI